MVLLVVGGLVKFTPHYRSRATPGPPRRLVSTPSISELFFWPTWSWDSGAAGRVESAALLARFNKPMSEVTRATLPMLLVLLVGVLLITYFPPLTMLAAVVQMNH